MVPDGLVDLVFSYDSLVHVELDVLREYVWQICQKLTPFGRAFIHHSNAASSASNAQEAMAGSRAMSVDSSIVRELIQDCGGTVYVQEEVTWIGRSRTDCMTTFGMLPREQPAVLLQNDDFLTEVALVRRFQSPYAAL